MSLNPFNFVAYSTPYMSPLDTTSASMSRQQSGGYFSNSPLTPTHADLTPLRAHYLKRELVSLQLLRELEELSQPDALAILGPPFSPTVSNNAGSPARQPRDIDLPFVRCKLLSPSALKTTANTVYIGTVVFHHFVLTLPMLAKASPTFFNEKLQPFVHSFLSRNISTSEDREQDTRRHRLGGKIEKYLGLVISSSIRLVENDGKEEVVRVAERSKNPFLMNKDLPSLPTKDADSDVFEVNVASVRSFVVRGRLGRKTFREEFLVRTRLGKSEVYVSRRYRDFNHLAAQLRKEFPEEDVRPPPPKNRKGMEAKTTNNSSGMPGDFSPTASFDSDNYIGGPTSVVNEDGQPLTLAREKNRLTLRAYLRSLLRVPAIASSDIMRDFLVLDPTTLTEQELKDLAMREEMDRVREAEMEQFKQEVDARVKELEVHLRAFKDEMIKKDGLIQVFATIRQTPKIEDLPIQYRKLIEWARISLASTIYQLFAGSDNSSATFAQLKRIHGLIPYFVLRGILRISNPMSMMRAFIDLFLARPFGQTSLLQRIFSSGLQDEVREIRQDMQLVASKVNQEQIIAKLDAFVNAPREVQDVYRQDAKKERLDLLAVILRSPEEPRLPSHLMHQILRSNAAYLSYLRNKKGNEAPDNDDAWLFEDLHLYLRMATRARDKEQLIELIFEGGTSEVLKDIVTIFYQPLAQVYRAANIADSLYDLQIFLNDLIKTVESAETAKVSDPQQTVQTFIDLVARHESAFYKFVHQVHTKGQGLFDDLMGWIELFINLVRDGFEDRISLECLLPAGGSERKAVMTEVDQVVEYHRQLKVAHHQRMQRRMVRGTAGEQAKSQDAAFVSGVMQSLNLESVGADVDELNAAESDEEHNEEDDDSEDDEDTPLEESRNPFRPATKVPKKSKKDRVILEPPTLEHIPKLVPLFVELMRPSLASHVRQVQRQQGQ